MFSLRESPHMAHNTKNIYIYIYIYILFCSGATNVPSWLK